jgi:hypothetical protein
VKSRRGRAVYPARVTDKIRPGCCFAPIHWNDLFGENLAINAATNEALDPISKQPEFKFCAVQIVKVQGNGKWKMARPLPGQASSTSPERLDGKTEALTENEETFTPAQKQYLLAFIAGLVASGRGSPALARGLPPDGPFSAAQRTWANGLFAGAFSDARAPGDADAPRKAAYV